MGEAMRLLVALCDGRFRWGGCGLKVLKFEEYLVK